MVSECFPVAKRDVKRGEVLDAIGETCYRGSIDLASVAREEHLLPLGLAKGMVTNRDIPRDTPITWDMVEAKESSVILDLRRKMDGAMS
jgi:predicted homoserine dehydrogenase-like protein